MTKTIGTVIVHLLSIASVLRLYFSLSDDQQKQQIFQVGIVVLCVVYIGAIAWEIISYVRTGPKRFLRFKEWRIRRYMRRWLKSGGRAVIFTRDMSWANDPTTLSVLHQKAVRRELTICIERLIPLAEALQRDGAEIILHGELGIIPRT
jgi:hypothetical protein